MPPEGFYLPPHLHLMPTADPVGDPRIAQRILLTHQRRRALFFAVDADDSHRFPHFLPGPSYVWNVIEALPQPAPLPRVDVSPTLQPLPLLDSRWHANPAPGGRRAAERPSVRSTPVSPCSRPPSRLG